VRLPHIEGVKVPLLYSVSGYRVRISSTNVAHPATDCVPPRLSANATFLDLQGCPTRYWLSLQLAALCYAALFVHSLCTGQSGLPRLAIWRQASLDVRGIIPQVCTPPFD